MNKHTEEIIGGGLASIMTSGLMAADLINILEASFVALLSGALGAVGAHYVKKLLNKLDNVKNKKGNRSKIA